MAGNQSQIQAALHRPYDRVLFAKDVLNPVFGSTFVLNTKPITPEIQPTKGEIEIIDEVVIFGYINLEDSTEVTCYEIRLQNNVRIEQSKVAIQRYVRKLLTVGQAAIICFVSPRNKNVWRLTFVSKDSEFTDVGVKEKITHAKRYTYLLGPSETCKTAAENFVNLSIEKELNLGALEKAFSVEKLSRAFFDEYTIHYNHFVSALTNSRLLDNNFSGDKKAARDFAKKLLGRIVFIYFLQKKGWLGASDLNYKDGIPDFTMQLFLTSGANNSFYSEWLSKLFFDTLNRERAKDNFSMPDGQVVKVPFLNGGLFDKDDYDINEIEFDHRLFHNKENPDDPKQRGFLDFLNAFNFTIHEDSPDDQTIAVDPEMLGHIFENLLEDNKDRGTFYTPKDIVHFMCQESLTEYLNIHLVNLERNNIENLVKQKDVSEDTRRFINELNELLDKVKVCDPAIGSGAFPMGLLQEIYAIKEVLSFENNTEWNPAKIKEAIIQNSIYGVDNEKGAVDIARLRFWLSLVVDEDKPRALPNLDYKIVVGDSLLSRVDGEIIEIDWEVKEGTQTNIFGIDNVVKRRDLLRDISVKQQNYFKPSLSGKKKLGAEIRSLKIEILINQLELMIKTKGFEPKANRLLEKYNKAQLELQEQTARWKKLIQNLNNLKSQPDIPFSHFDWKLDFPEILNPYLVQENGGFDIVIANPPYVKESTNKKAFEGLKSHPLYQGKMDLWYFFGHLGIILSKKQTGVNCFIATNNWITNDGASKFRNFVLTNSVVEQFDDFGDHKIFVSAGIQTMIYLLKIQAVPEDYEVKYLRLHDQKITGEELKVMLAEPFNVSTKKWNKNKVTFTANKFLDKYISFVESPVIDLISNASNFSLKENEIFSGIDVLQDFVSKSHLSDLNYEGHKVGNGIFVLTTEEVDKLNLTKHELKKVKPYYTTKELNRFVTIKQNKFWIIYADRSVFENIDAYPNIQRHLSKFTNIMTSVNKPFGLHRSREEQIFIGPKILSIRKCAKLSFTFTEFDTYVSRAFLIIKSSRIDLKFLTGLLNSSTTSYWLRIKGKLQGNNFQIDKEPLLSIPIVKPNSTIKFNRIVDYILFLNSNTLNDVQDELMAAYFEQILDGMVYDLYFPEILKKHEREILKHLDTLPEFEIDSTDIKKLQICRDVFKLLDNRNHPIRTNLFYMNSIPEIKLIESLNENN